MPSRNKKATALFVLLANGLALATTGCEQKTMKAAVPVASTPMPQPLDSKPLTNVAPDTTATPPEVVEDNAPPPTPPPSSAAPLSVTSPRTKPAPPPRKQPSEQQTADASAEQSARPPEPLISPQL